MRILVVGDVFGKAGRRTVQQIVPRLIREHDVDLVVANAENLCGGRGLSSKHLKVIWDAGVHVVTTGNHVWHNKEIYDFIDDDKRILRPANFPEPCPGRGITVVETANGTPVAVINLIGRMFMPPVDCPFQKVDALLDQLDPSIKIRLVDLHAEATSEKVAMAWYLDGRASLMAGTHTHIQTADERILPEGLAAITDLGMTGPYDSVIGMRKEAIIKQFLDRRPTAFVQANRGAMLCGVLLDVDAASGRAESIKRLAIPLEG